MHHVLDQALAERLARVALGHVTREYPFQPGHVLAGPDDARTPAQLHPVFHGSYDWHSCVHGFWMLARLLRRYPGMAAAPAIAALFDRHLTPDKVAAECAYLAQPTARGFERPYGWAWLLKLASELAQHPGRPWAANLQPLAQVFVTRFLDFLPLATYPVRTGTHFNTAFALRLAADYAEVTRHAALGAALHSTALRWYGDDVDCPAWGEPGGDEFLSPTLVEAECLRALLSATAFAAWRDRFLPGLGAGRPACLFQPPTVSDRTDGKIAHLDGLSLSRAWCWRALAATWEPSHPCHGLALRAAALHLDAGLPYVTGHYMGEHWLASFAVLALDA